MTVTRSWHVDAPVETVFDFFKDPGKWEKVALFDLKDVKVTKDGVGTNYEWNYKLGALRLGGFEVLTEVEPYKRIVERSSMSMVGKWFYTFRPEGKGTRVTIGVQPRSFWSIPPLARLVEMGVARMGETAMPRYIEAMESPTKEQKTQRKRQRKPAGTR